MTSDDPNKIAHTTKNPAHAEAAARGFGGREQPAGQGQAARQTATEKRPGRPNECLHRALLEFQSRCPVIAKTQFNSFTNSNFAGLEDIMSVSQPLLTDLKLAVFYTTCLMPLPDNSGFVSVLTCKIVHTVSNEVMESSLPLPDPSEGPQGAQIVGGYIRYWRRYLFCAMTNIIDSTDTDGNDTITQPVAPRLTEKQHSEILDFMEATGTLMGDPDTQGTLMHHVSTVMQLSELEQLSGRQATTIIKMLKTKLKRQQNG